MSLTKIINAVGLACPQPVVLAKQALESNDRIKVIVDNETALENIKRLGGKLGCAVSVDSKNDGIFEILLNRETDAPKPAGDGPATAGASAAPGPFVMVCAGDKMGRGNDELGGILIRAFFHTIAEQSEKPDVVIFYNTGVKLTLQGSEVLDDLKTLAAAGVELLVCGTCLNYFEAKDKLAMGMVSNMYDIAQTMSKAGRLLTP